MHPLCFFLMKIKSMTAITSKDNPTIKSTHALLTQSRARKKMGKTVLEGTHLLDAYLSAGLTPETVIISESAYEYDEILSLLNHMGDCRLLVITDALYQYLSTLGASLPIMAIIPIPERTLTSAITGDCLIINGVQDNGNLGTLLRTASAVGFDTVICTQGSAHAYTPKSLRAGMGAQFSLTLYENISLDDVLTHVRTPLYATSSHSDALIYHTDLTAPVALIMGHEGQGVDERLLARASALTLPQPNGQESLNVGVAGSLCLYEILRQRRYA